MRDRTKAAVGFSAMEFNLKDCYLSLARPLCLISLPHCPKCGSENKKPANEWVGGAKTYKPMKVQRFVCAARGTNFVAWKDSKTGEIKSMARR
jgi:hypothetical protein